MYVVMAEGWGQDGDCMGQTHTRNCPNANSRRLRNLYIKKHPENRRLSCEETQRQASDRERHLGRDQQDWASSGSSGLLFSHVGKK